MQCQEPTGVAMPPCPPPMGVILEQSLLHFGHRATDSLHRFLLLLNGLQTSQRVQRAWPGQPPSTQSGAPLKLGESAIESTTQANPVWFGPALINAPIY